MQHAHASMPEGEAMRWLDVWKVTVFLVVVCVSGVAVMANPPKKVYVPNPTGDASEKIGAVIASEISAALMKHGIQAFTYANLKEQLKQEEYKEVLQCKADDRCVDEVVAGFGVATRVFTQVTRMGKNSHHLELSLETKGKLKRKVTDTVSCRPDQLPSVASRLAMQLLGLGGVLPVEPVAPGGQEELPPEVPPPAKEFAIGFHSEPAGALVEIDGKPKKATPCSLYIGEGAHTVRMILARYEPKQQTIVFDSDRSVSWTLQPTFGWLDITTDPAGLKVTVSRQGRSESETLSTPVKNKELAPGAYKVRVVDGRFHTTSQGVAVRQGKRAVVELAPKEKQGYLKVKVFDEGGNALPAEVFAGGSRLGKAPGPWLLRIGRHAIEVRAEGHQTGKEAATVESGAAVEVKVTLKSSASSAATGDMVLIPAGKFMMGCNETVDSEWQDDEKPYHEVYLDAYSIDRHEVTLSDYRKCVESGKCKEPGSSGECNWGKSDRSNHPVNCVDWTQAGQYCEYAGKRLPTEAEWEKAARGTDGRKFPWGNGKVTGRKANYCDSNCTYDWKDSGQDDGYAATSPVCSFESGNSPYGLCDMAGNVWEWVSDWYGKDYYASSGRRNPSGPSSGKKRVLRGGSWLGEAGSLRASDRLRRRPVFWFNCLGFRCVVSSE